MPRDSDQAKEINESLARMKVTALALVAQLEALREALQFTDDDDDAEDVSLAWTSRGMQDEE